MEEQRDQASHHALAQSDTPALGSDYEISLFDLWCFLLKQWKIIGAITCLSLLGAFVYMFLATPVYEAQAVVKRSEGKYVEVLNIPGISQVSNADIFVKFTENLKSGSLRQLFVEEKPQFSSLRGNVPDIREGKKNESGLFFVSLQGHEAKLLADWVNALILRAEKRTIEDFFDTIEVKIANQKKEIEKQLQIGRDFASQRRLDRIALLENQITIARASKIFDRQIYGYSVEKESQKFGVTVDTLQGPMYMRGVKELTAEKEELEKRKNDEPFIAGFRDKQESLAQLDAGLELLHAARAVARAVTVDQPAIQAKSPVKPKWMRVLSLSLVSGVLLGIFAAFVVNFVQQQKNEAN